jgi:CheY-like chemotaxis protein
MDHAKDSGEAFQERARFTNALLIVDDTEEGRAAIEQACTSIPGIDLCVVSSALEAVRILEDRDKSIAAVVTDIRMPRMDGFALIEFIRAHQRHSAMPIVVVTADTDPSTPQRASQMGANAYFAKPFSPRAIQRTLEELLHAK